MHERQTPKGESKAVSGAINAQTSNGNKPEVQSSAQANAHGEVHARPHVHASGDAHASSSASQQAQQVKPKPQAQQSSPSAHVHSHPTGTPATSATAAGASASVAHDAAASSSMTHAVSSAPKPQSSSQASQQSATQSSAGTGAGSGKRMGLPTILVVVIAALVFLFSSGGAGTQTDASLKTAGMTGDSAAQSQSSLQLAADSAVDSASDSVLVPYEAVDPAETPGKSRGLLDFLFGLDSSSYYDNSQSVSAYQIDNSLGQGNPNETWTVLMYLCGSDLESTPARQGGGQATNNLVELSKANLGQNVTYIVQTGGAKAWQNNVISPRYLSRYAIQNGKMALLDQQPSASMAAQSTFADFLKWGTTNYPADHYMVVIWDHGGGSITGVCQDDIYPYDSKGNADSLTLPEMRDAMKSVGAKFDVIGFDTCLMATVETAQILSPYGNYMVASEESEPGAGWDYTSWPNWLAAHPGTSGKDLGTVICQTYYNKCGTYRQQGMATLSVIDLAKVGTVSKAFENASDDIAFSTIDNSKLRRLQQGAKSAESFGETGFYRMNMVDLADLMSKTGDVIGSDATDVINAIDQAVVYEVHGRNRASASGLSVYYPLQIMDRNDFKRYSAVTNNTPYLQFLAVMFGVYDNYEWNKFDNFVPLHGEPVVEKDLKIKYKQAVNKAGHVQLQITEGVDQVADVAFEMYVYLDQLGILCYLGSDNDMNGSYDTGKFVDNFQDDWLTIDGHYVSASLCEVGEGYNLYYVPILLNGEQTGLVINYDFQSNEYNALCVWDEANQATGMSAKTGRLLEEGDQVQFLFPAENAKTGINAVIPLETMTWHEDAEIVYEGLGDGSFAFRYQITDVLGNRMNTPLVHQTYKNGKVAK